MPQEEPGGGHFSPNAIKQQVHAVLVLALSEADWVTDAGQPVTDAYENCFVTRGDRVNEAQAMMQGNGAEVLYKAQVYILVKATAHDIYRGVRAMVESASKFACVSLNTVYCEEGHAGITLDARCIDPIRYE